MKSTERECLLCGGSAELRHKAYPGYQRPDTFEIYHCQRCNTAFSLPRVETATIYEHIYAHGNKIPGYDRYWRYAQLVKRVSRPLEYLARKENTYWGVRAALPAPVAGKKATKLLEIGSGLGYLTYALLKANYDAVGLDISGLAVRAACEAFGDHYVCGDVYEYAQRHPGSFDVVVLTDVIEHVDRPVAFIEAIKNLLKPGGRAIVTAPNKSFFSRDVIWTSDLPPVHCWWFSEQSMRYIAKALNLNVQFINFREFYRHNYHAERMRALLNGGLPASYLSRDGELIVRAAGADEALKSWLIKRIPYASRIYGKVMESFSDDFIVCRDRGILLCATMQRP